MDSGYDQVIHGLMVGGVGFPVLAALIGVVINLVTSGSVRMLTATRLVFVVLALGIGAAATSGSVPAAEAASCLVGQLLAWSLLLGPQRRRKKR